MKKTINTVKFEKKHPGKIIKHLTNVQVDPALLAQPQLTTLDMGPEYMIKEFVRQKTLERQNTMGLNIDCGLDNFKINVVQPASLEENDYALVYNKGQLQKLKDGLTHVSRHMSKYKVSRSSSRSRVSENASKAIDDSSMKSDDEDELQRSSRLMFPDGDSEAGDHIVDSSRRKKKSSFFRRNAAVRMKLDDRVRAQVDMNLNPREEFLKVIGMTEKSKTPNNKLGFFLLHKNSVSAADSLQRPHATKKPTKFLSETQSPMGSKWMVTRDDEDKEDEIKLADSFYMAKQQDKCLKKPGTTSTNLSRTYESNVHKDLRVQTTSITNKRTSLDFRVSSHHEEDNENLKRYRELSVNCNENIRSTSAIQSAMQKDFGQLNSMLTKISGGITTPTTEVDNRIKDEIFAYMKSPHNTISNHLRKPKPKHNKNNRGA